MVMVTSLRTLPGRGCIYFQGRKMAQDQDTAKAVEAFDKILDEYFSSDNIAARMQAEIYLMHAFRDFAQGPVSNDRIMLKGPEPGDHSTVPLGLLSKISKLGDETASEIARHLVAKYDAQVVVQSEEEYRAKRMAACVRELERDYSKPGAAFSLHAVLLSAATGPLVGAPEHGGGMLKYPNGVRVNYQMTEMFYKFVKADGTLGDHGREMLDHLDQSRGPASVIVGSDGMITGIAVTKAGGGTETLTAGNYYGAPPEPKPQPVTAAQPALTTEPDIRISMPGPSRGLKP